ncbi:siderophore-interacting protein [Streptomyces sp. NPDC050560]|uniref:siderophore-interacting protein n=1 Tax=Streptomyces sp. NPDC050560 TaxID=3365630 RepID=UPI00379C1B45
MTVPARRRLPTGLSGRPTRLFPVRVARRTALTPHMARITFEGPALADFADDGPDQRVKLILPRADGPGLDLPADLTPLDILALPEAERPLMRTYTVRDADPEARRVSVDFALHHPAGPATEWAAAARPGAEAALFGPVAAYAPPPDTAWQLIAGDETALPAIAAIVERLPARMPAHVVVSVPAPSAVLPLAVRPDTNVTWLPRTTGEPEGAEDRLTAAVRAANLPPGPGYAWVAAEQSVAGSVRRHLVHERGMDRDRIYFSGYWRRGKSEGDA